MSSKPVKVLVRMNTSAEHRPGGPCMYVTPSQSAASGKSIHSMPTEKRHLVELAHHNALNSPRSNRKPKAKPLRKQTSSLPPASPVPPLRINPELLVVHPKHTDIKLESPTELATPTHTLPPLDTPPSLPKAVILRTRWTLCASRKAEDA